MSTTHSLLDGNLQHYLLLVEDLCNFERNEDWINHWAIVSYRKDDDQRPAFLTFPSSICSWWDTTWGGCIISPMFGGQHNNGGLVTIGNPHWCLSHRPREYTKLGSRQDIEKQIGLWEIPYEVLERFLVLLAL